MEEAMERNGVFDYRKNLSKLDKLEKILQNVKQFFQNIDPSENKAEADFLDMFFKDLKIASKSDENVWDAFCKIYGIGEDGRNNLRNINFNVGGKNKKNSQQGGFMFEKEVKKLLKGITIKGTTKANAVIDINDIEDSTIESIRAAFINVYIRMREKVIPQKKWLEVSDYRDGKIDIKGTKLSFSIDKTNTNAARLEKILTNRGFSLKNYSINATSVDLGDAGMDKAILSVLSYFASDEISVKKVLNSVARVQHLMNNNYIESKVRSNNIYDNILKDLKIIKEIYEISGFGLQYRNKTKSSYNMINPDAGRLPMADFLILNRYEKNGNKITVDVTGNISVTGIHGVVKDLANGISTTASSAILRNHRDKLEEYKKKNIATNYNARLRNGR